MKVSFHCCWQNTCGYVQMYMSTDHAAALLAAVQPGRSAAIECASTLVQALAVGPVVAARTAEQILVWISAVTGSPPAVRLRLLHNRRSQWSAGKQCQGMIAASDK